MLICSSTDTHARYHRGGGAGRQAHLLREADRPLAWSASIARSRPCETAGVKLQIGFNRRFDANFARVRKAVVQRRDRRARSCCTSSAAIPRRRRFVREGFGRHVPRHDDSRLRHGALPDRRRSGGDLHRGRRDGGPGNRRGRRCGYGGDHAALPQRRDRHDRQQPEGGLRLRPASRGLRQRGRHRHRQIATPTQPSSARRDACAAICR